MHLVEIERSEWSYLIKQEAVEYAITFMDEENEVTTHVDTLEQGQMTYLQNFDANQNSILDIVDEYTEEFEEILAEK